MREIEKLRSKNKMKCETEYKAECVVCGNKATIFRGVLYAGRGHFRIPLCAGCEEELSDQYIQEAKDSGVIQFLE